MYIVATPIGNLRDITLRALDLLAAADLVLCEDTRVTARLFSAYGLSRPMLPYHEHNAARMRPQILARLADGARIALVSDAGTPLISDPGYRLVREVQAAGHAVVALPGASAVLAGLVVSGLPSDRFLFAGFLPPRSAARRTAAAALGAVRATLILYEAARRLPAMLADLEAALGPREAVVARELTKRFEEVQRGRLDVLAAHYAAAGPPRGEVVVLVAPEDAASAPPPAAAEAGAEAALRAALAGGASVRDAAARVAAATGQPRRALYRRALELDGALELERGLESGGNPGMGADDGAARDDGG